MEKIKALLEEQMDSNLIQMILSNPRKRVESAGDSGMAANKVNIRPVLLAGDVLVFQMSSYVGAQVFHANYGKQEIIAEVLRLLQNHFKQMELTSANCIATALISKKGTVTLKRKKTQMTDATETAKDRLAHNRTKKYLLQEGTPVPFLIDLGVQTPDGKIVRSKYDKFKQINRFLELIADILPALPRDRRVSILDFGCGKSYLTFAMYYYLKVLQQYDLEVIGLDLKSEVIRHCNELKDKYGYEGLHFLEGDISTYNEKKEVDMVVTLHACDTATDYAIAKAISWNARVILSVPCCQHELNRQMKCESLAPIMKYGLIKERMAALFTDGIRANIMELYGYETQVMEFIDMEHTPKNILLRGVRTEGFRGRRTTMQEVLDLLELLCSEQTLVNLMK